MAVQVLMAIALVMAVLFIWRSSGRNKGLSGLAAALAAGAGILLFKNPVLVLLAVVAALLLIQRASGEKQ